MSYRGTCPGSTTEGRRHVLAEAARARGARLVERARGIRVSRSPPTSPRKTRRAPRTPGPKAGGPSEDVDLAALAHTGRDALVAPRRRGRARRLDGERGGGAAREARRALRAARRVFSVAENGGNASASGDESTADRRGIRVPFRVHINTFYGAVSSRTRTAARSPGASTWRAFEAPFARHDGHLEQRAPLSVTNTRSPASS